jgi:hypothetical protein
MNNVESTGLGEREEKVENVSRQFASLPRDREQRKRNRFEEIDGDAEENDWCFKHV